MIWEVAGLHASLEISVSCLASYASYLCILEMKNETVFYIHCYAAKTQYPTKKCIIAGVLRQVL